MTTPNLEHVWPEWTIEKQIGRGTYGAVYQAVRRSNDLTSRAAIKVISIPQDPYELESLRADGLDLHASRTYLKRIVDDFVNEIRLMESFKGIQNIVSIEDYKVLERTDAIGWDIYIRMELLTPFSAYVCDRKLSEEDVIQLGCDICTALEICSRRDIIHRDIKPENIFVNDFGSFKLGDFGTARKMESLMGGLSQKGTYNYMAPEVINGSDYDARVDVYSLGLVLYRLMNGNRLPFVSEKQLLSPSERRNAFDRRIRGEALPPPCEASPAMAQVILRACAFDPQQRFASASQLRQALQQVARRRDFEEEIPAQVPPTAKAPPEPKPRPARKKRVEKKKPDSPAMAVNAPAMVISAPAFSVQEANAPKKRSPKRKPWVKMALFILLILTILAGSGLMIYRFGNWPVELTLWSSPNKQIYQWGESLQTDGMKMLVQYRNGDWKLLEEGFWCTPNALKSSGRQEIKVRYLNVCTSFWVDVQVGVSGISVASLPEKTVYATGDALKTEGLTLEVKYSDGSKKIVKDGFTCSPTTVMRGGTNKITVTYQGKTATFPVEIPELTGLRVSALPTKTIYTVGEDLEVDGLTLEALYSDGSRTTVESEFSCSPETLEREGTTLVTVTYKGKTATFPVEVPRLTEIKVAQLPEKTKYKVGEYLETRGMVLEGLYSDGKTYTITDGFSCNPTGFGRKGTMDITVTYQDKTTSFPVEVIGVSGVRLVTTPDKTTYVVGDMLETDGMTLEVQYSDGSKEIVSDGYFCQPEYLAAEGTTDIRVTYQGFANTIRVKVTDGSHMETGDFRFENLDAYVSGWCNEETGAGYNANGVPVNWVLWIDFDLPEALERRSRETITCSWDHVVNGSGTWEKEVDFQSAKEGVTFSEFGVTPAENSSSGKRRFSFMLMLPDDASIAGTQAVTVAVGTVQKTITFELVYLGDYETDIGWDIANVQL